MRLTQHELGLIEDQPLLKSRAELRRLIDAVCAEVHVLPEEILGKTRGTDVVCAARDAIIQIADWRGYSAAEIGRILGRDHSTIKHAIDKGKRKYPTGYPPSNSGNSGANTLHFSGNRAELKRGETMLETSSAPNRDLIEKGSRNG